MNSSEIIKTTILNLIEEFFRKFCKEESFDKFCIETFFKTKQPDEIKNYIIKYIFPYKKMIEDKDKNYFIENNFIFKILDEDKIEKYKKIFEKMDDINEKILWEYIDIIVWYTENDIETYF